MKGTGIKALREKAKQLKPTINIGKRGLTASLISEVKKQLKKHGLVKLKMLKSSGMARKEAAARIAMLTGSELVDAVGFIVVLNRKQKG